MRQSKLEGSLRERAIIEVAVILKPSRMCGVLVKMARADVVMLTAHHPAKA